MEFGLLLKLLNTLRSLRQHEQWSRERLLDYQSAQLSRLRAHAVAHSPFYRRFHEGRTSRWQSCLY